MLTVRRSRLTSIRSDRCGGVRMAPVAVTTFPLLTRTALTGPRSAFAARHTMSARANVGTQKSKPASRAETRLSALRRCVNDERQVRAKENFAAIGERHRERASTPLANLAGWHTGADGRGDIRFG